MKNLSSYFKSIFLSALNIISFVACMYLSIIFFLILLAEESVKGRKNEPLKEEFASVIQKISDIPQSLFSPMQKEGVDLSGTLS
jgi:hypothetical protein